MNRREMITLLGSAATWPVAARAQAMPVIGVLGSEAPDLYLDRLRAFRQGLSETGFVEGRNVAIEYRWAEGYNDRLPALAADLVRRQVTIIATLGSLPAVPIAKAATSTIPIVFAIGADPVTVGLVASLSRPGGNVTGVTSLNVEVGPKRLELLHELVPAASVIALLINPTNPAAQTQSREMQAAARAFGLQFRGIPASTESDLDTAFATLAGLRGVGLVIGIDPFFTNRIEHLAARALRQAVPAIYHLREFAAAGGLMSYGGSVAESNRLAGIYAGRILKGEKPADLPVQQATKVELVINLKTAKSLGLAVPLALLTRADEVIE